MTKQHAELQASRSGTENATMDSLQQTPYTVHIQTRPNNHLISFR